MAPHPPPSHSYQDASHYYYNRHEETGWNQEQSNLYNQPPRPHNYSQSSPTVTTHRPSPNGLISHNQSVHHPHRSSAPSMDAHFHGKQGDHGWNPRPTHPMNGSTHRPFVEKENGRGMEEGKKNLPRPHPQSSNFKKFKNEKEGLEGGKEAPTRRINSKGISSSTSSDPVNHGLSPHEKREFASLIQDLWSVQRFAQEFKKYSVIDYVKVRDLIGKMKEDNEKKRYGK